MNAVPPPTRARRPRLFYLDLVRALATFLIVLTHFNNPYLAGGGYLLTNQPFGIYVGGLGVSLFLIISGAALAHTYGERLELRTFYWKRFKGIYPMFWIAWTVAVLYYFLDTHGRPPITAPVRNVIFTVVGFDGYLANFHVQTAYLLGEWFLGFIVMFYVVFPLLMAAVNRWPLLTAVVVLGAYAASEAWALRQPGVPSALILTIRLPELMFGMYFVRYVRRVPAWLAVPAVGVLVVSSLMPERIPEDLATTAVGIAAFIILVVLGRFIAIGPVKVLVGLVAKYSYPIFLVHHVVIMQTYAKVNTMGFVPVQRVVMFLAVCAVTGALAVVLERVTGAITVVVAKGFDGRWWRVELPSAER